MKKQRLFSVLLLLSLLLSLLSASVCAEEPFTVEAKAALLIDLNSGRTIYEQNSEDRVYPASLTKIMTCLLALENGNLSDIVTVGENAYAGMDESSSSAGLLVGEQMTLEQMLYCMMIVSGNEACNVVAEHIAGSVDNFVKMMNERADELGCSSTHFCNPHGLHDSEHYTTARDLATITQAALKSTVFRKITSTEKYTLPATNLSEERELRTTNLLMDSSTGNRFYYSKASGIKTGFTSQAGRCLISTAADNGMSLLAVICGAGTSLLSDNTTLMESFPQCIRLFDYGFEQFAYITALSTLYPIAQIGVRNSIGAESVSLAPEETIKLLLSKDYKEELLKKDIHLDAEEADAPIAAGDAFGYVDVYYDGELMDSTRLLAIADIAKSDISAAASNTGAYIQRNWWKWMVIAIVLAIAAFAVFVVVTELRRKKERRLRMEKRRQALRQQMDEWEK